MLDKLFPKDILGEIVKFLTYDEICVSQLIKYVTESGWKHMTISYFGDMICNYDSCGTYSSWYDYFHYVHYMKFGKAKFLSLDFTNKIDIKFLYLVSSYDNSISINSLLETQFAKDHSKESKEIYNAGVKLKRGDLLIIGNTSYYIDIVNSEKKILLGNGNGTSNHISLTPIFEFPLLYWDINEYLKESDIDEYLKESDIDNLVESHGYLLNFNPSKINFLTLDTSKLIQQIDDIYPKQVYIFEHENIYYTLIGYDECDDDDLKIIDCENLLFSIFKYTESWNIKLSPHILDYLKTHYHIEKERILIYDPF